VSWIVSWVGEARCWRWRAAKERPIVPAPMRVMRIEESEVRSLLVGVVIFIDYMDVLREHEL